MANNNVRLKIVFLLAVLLFFLSFFSSSVFAATCGDGVAEGNEECDGGDLRGFWCGSVCSSFDSPIYGENECSSGFNEGTLSCKSDCTYSTFGCYYRICGDGTIHGLEECDDGSSNSDFQPDACRTDCTRSKCGDHVVDTGEQCDEGNSGSDRNDDRLPNQCRTDCREPWCGDGVLDYAEGEECDPAILGTDVCNSQCIECYDVEDDLHISKSGRLCYHSIGEIEIADNGEEGVLIIHDNPTGETVILDCGGVKLIGPGMSLLGGMDRPPLLGSGNVFDSPVGGPSGNASPLLTPAPEDDDAGLVTRLFRSLSSVFFGSFVMAQTGGQVYVGQGTGIRITGSNVVLNNCEVENYRTGVKVEGSGAVLTNNFICGNSMDISASSTGNFGTKNLCDIASNWNENGGQGCTFTCSGALRTQPTECPECVCTCPTCEEVEPSSTTTSSTTTSTRETTTTTSTTTTTLPTKLCSSDVYPKRFTLCEDDCPEGTRCTADCTCLEIKLTLPQITTTTRSQVTTTTDTTTTTTIPGPGPLTHK